MASQGVTNAIQSHVQHLVADLEVGRGPDRRVLLHSQDLPTSTRVSVDRQYGPPPSSSSNCFDAPVFADLRGEPSRQSSGEQGTSHGQRSVSASKWYRCCSFFQRRRFRGRVVGLGYVSTIWIRLPQVSSKRAIVTPATSVGSIANATPSDFSLSCSARMSETPKDAAGMLCSKIPF